MKTIFSKMLIVAATLLGSLFVTSAKAQIANPYPVKNTLPCPVTITFEVYVGNNQGGTVPPCLLCSSTPGVIIPPGGTVMIPHPACVPVCDVAVTVTAIGGIILPVPVTDRLSTAGPTSGPGAACAPVVTINVMPGSAIIN